MTEHEALLAGKIFSPVAKELVDIKLKAHNLSVKYSQTYEDQAEERAQILSELLGGMGNGVRIQGPIFFNYGVHTKIGNKFFANYNFTVQDDALVTIGDGVNIGPNVTITTPFHPLIAQERGGFTDNNGNEYPHPCYAKPINIGNNVWIGANVTICGGVTIGDGAVIGAGAVVVKDIPANALAVGVPARVLRIIGPEDSMLNHPEYLL